MSSLNPPGNPTSFCIPTAPAGSQPHYLQDYETHFLPPTSSLDNYGSRLAPARMSFLKHMAGKFPLGTLCFSPHCWLMWVAFPVCLFPQAHLLPYTGLAAIRKSPQPLTHPPPCCMHASRPAFSPGTLHSLLILPGHLPYEDPIAPSSDLSPSTLPTAGPSSMPSCTPKASGRLFKMLNASLS